MRQIAKTRLSALPATLTLCVTLSLALGLSTAVPRSAAAEESNSLSLMEDGMRLMLRGLIEQAEPALRELEGLSQEMEPAIRGFVENFGPNLGALLEQVEDFSKYHPPEILPNGDIILRRKTPKDLALDDKDGFEL